MKIGWRGMWAAGLGVLALMATGMALAANEEEAPNAAGP